MIYSILRSSVLSMWPSLIIVGVSLFAVRMAYIMRHNEQVKFYREFWMLFTIIYIIMLYQMVTKVDLNVTHGYNIIPFKEILRYDFKSELFILNIIGNIVAFLPLGYLIAEYIKPRNVWTNTVLAMIISATIEIVQINIGRSFDIDDIILNTFGCILGYLFYKLITFISDHLPRIFKSDGFKNLICFIILLIGVVYVLKIMGILNI